MNKRMEEVLVHMVRDDEVMSHVTIFTVPDDRFITVRMPIGYGEYSRERMVERIELHYNQGMVVILQDRRSISGLNVDNIEEFCVYQSIARIT